MRRSSGMTDGDGGCGESAIDVEHYQSGRASATSGGRPGRPGAGLECRQMDRWDDLQSRIVNCTRCPRLREHCTRMASEKRASFRNEDYWGKPLPNLGPPGARLLLVGLAPAA